MKNVPLAEQALGYLMDLHQSTFSSTPAEAFDSKQKLLRCPKAIRLIYLNEAVEKLRPLMEKIGMTEAFEGLKKRSMHWISFRPPPIWGDYSIIGAYIIQQKPLKTYIGGVLRHWCGTDYQQNRAKRRQVGITKTAFLLGTVAHEIRHEVQDSDRPHSFWDLDEYLEQHPEDEKAIARIRDHSPREQDAAIAELLTQRIVYKNRGFSPDVVGKIKAVIIR